MRGLYAITPETTDLPNLVDQVGQAVAGGASVVQYRNKSFPLSAAIMQAKALQTLLSKTGVLFIINDNIELAINVCGQPVSSMYRQRFNRHIGYCGN